MTIGELAYQPRISFHSYPLPSSPLNHYKTKQKTIHPPFTYKNLKKNNGEFLGLQDTDNIDAGDPVQSVSNVQPFKWELQNTDDGSFTLMNPKSGKFLYGHESACIYTGEDSSCVFTGLLIQGTDLFLFVVFDHELRREFLEVILSLWSDN